MDELSWERAARLARRSVSQTGGAAPLAGVSSKHRSRRLFVRDDVRAPPSLCPVCAANAPPSSVRTRRFKHGCVDGKYRGKDKKPCSWREVIQADVFFFVFFL